MSFDIYIEEGLRNMKLLENYVEVARRVKEIVLKHDRQAKVYVFGSVVEGKYTAASDIDILIVTNLCREVTYRLKAEIYETIDAPVELHIVNQTQFEWYRKFINKLIEV